MTNSQMCFLYFTLCECVNIRLLCEGTVCVSMPQKRKQCVRLYSLIISFSENDSRSQKPSLYSSPVLSDSLGRLLLSPLSWNDCVCPLTNSLLAGQWTLQGQACGRHVWTGAGLKHGGDVEGLQAQTQNMSGNIHRPHTLSIIPCL